MVKDTKLNECEDCSYNGKMFHSEVLKKIRQRQEDSDTLMKVVLGMVLTTAIIVVGATTLFNRSK